MHHVQSRKGTHRHDRRRRSGETLRIETRMLGDRVTWTDTRGPWLADEMRIERLLQEIHADHRVEKHAQGLTQRVRHQRPAVQVDQLAHRPGRRVVRVGDVH